MTKTTQLGRALHVAGIELRTSNDEARRSIPPHWQRFTEGGGLTRWPQRLTDDVIAVYTHFEDAGRSNRGLYSLIVGALVPPDAPLPAGCVRAVVPASQRAVFAVDGGPQQVGEAWQAIWQREDLRKSYFADYEHYRADGTIEISIGIT